MIDWLRRAPRQAPEVEVAGRRLPVEIRRLDHARRMTLRLAPAGDAVRLSIPAWVPTREALAFAEARRDWLARQLAAVPDAVEIADGMTLPFRGQDLTIRHSPDAPRKPHLLHGELRVGGIASSLPSRLRRWLQDEARQVLAIDLADYCARIDRVAPPLSLSAARRRWGSCSAGGAIRINWRLVMAPDAVRRSVVAHEVTHLVEFNHSPAFHRLLGSLFEGDVEAANRWLATHGRGLYQPFG